jgi:hypothetical protein
MSNLSVFRFDGQDVRFVGTPDKPEWVAQDVCNILGIQNASDAIKRLDDYQKGVASVYTLGGNQKMVTVTEAGLYALIFTSRKSIAKDFQRWVFEEVLPAIRKTGQYNSGGRKNIIWFDRYQLFKERSRIPPGYFSIFGELSHTLISDFESAGYVLPDNSGIDISAGKRWSDYVESKYPHVEKLRMKYKHHYPDQRGVRDAFIYQDCLLAEFRKWLEFTYKINHLYTYLKKKDPRAIGILSDLLQVQLSGNLFDLKLLN